MVAPMTLIPHGDENRAIATPALAARSNKQSWTVISHPPLVRHNRLKWTFLKSDRGDIVRRCNVGSRNSRGKDVLGAAPWLPGNKPYPSHPIWFAIPSFTTPLFVRFAVYSVDRVCILSNDTKWCAVDPKRERSYGRLTVFQSVCNTVGANLLFFKLMFT